MHESEKNYKIFFIFKSCIQYVFSVFYNSKFQTKLYDFFLKMDWSVLKIRFISMKISQLLQRFMMTLGLSSITMPSYANDVEVSNNAVNYVLWFAVLAGIVAGLLTYGWLYRNFKSHERLKSWFAAVVVAVIVASIPLFVSDFSSVCMQQITDGSGQVREMVSSADQCVLSREGVSAWGIAAVISGFKGALGYSASGSFLSTGAVKFFYYMVVIFWTSVLYLLSLWAWKKIKN